MKKLLSICLLVFLNLHLAFSQIEYSKLGVEALGGLTISLMDASNDQMGSTFGGAFQYNTSPYSFVSFDIQSGTLKAGLEGNLRKFKNSYSSYALSYNFGLGDFLPSTANNVRRRINELYLGAGLGIIKSNVKEVHPFEYTTDDGIFTEGINYNETDYYFPLQLGINVKYYNKRSNKVPFAVNLCYQFNVTFSDLLDGYEGSPGNKHDDYYNTLWLGIKYYFGPSTIYYRQPKLRYY